MNPQSPIISIKAPEHPEKTPLNGADRSLGSILIKVGRLTINDAEKIMAFQTTRNMCFGDAAVELGILTPADIDFALSRQFEYPYLLRGESAIREEVIAAYEPFSIRVEELRVLRNQLMWRWFETAAERRALAITSAERGDGRSFIAANLAVVFSHQGQRTLLIDADMRNPRQHQIFNLENRVGLSSMLAGRHSAEAIQRVHALQDLSVLTAGPLPPNPLELLGRPIFSQLLKNAGQQYDVILIDTPAGSDCSDAQTVAVRAGAAIVVTRKDVSHVNKVRQLVTSLTDVRAQVVGSVLNDF